MSDTWSEGGGRAASEAAAARQLLELWHTIERIGREENRLEAHIFQLQSQIARYQDQAQAAQTARSENLLNLSLERLNALRTQLAGAQERLSQLKAYKDSLNRQRDALQQQLNALRSPQPQVPVPRWESFGPDAPPSAAPAQSWPAATPPWELAPPRPRRSRFMLWFASFGIALIVCAALLGAVRLLLQLPGLPGNPIPSITDQQVYTPSGDVPDNARCVARYGGPCYSPQDIQQAFRLNPLYSKGDTGKGQTIVLLSAGKTNQLQADLQAFDHAWGLPAASLSILQPFGPPAPYTCPDGLDDLQSETALDVEWAHAIAPGAKIVVLIGSNNSHRSPQDNCYLYGLSEALSYAISRHLGDIISLSYGSSELGDVSETPAEQASDRRFYQDEHQLFQRATGEGITILAASGDDGATNPNDTTKATSYWSRPNVSWPASDPNVLAVGGTKLSIDPDNSVYVREVAWNDEVGATGGGLSAVFDEPAYQKTVPNQALLRGKRGIPDVSFPAEDFLIYDLAQPDSLVRGNAQLRHWGLVGGTSISAPCWAGLIAIANQIRGKPLGLIQPALYRLAGKDMHDILTGDNTSHQVEGYQAQQGYDLVTGWGTPVARDFLPALVAAANQLQQTT